MKGHNKAIYCNHSLLFTEIMMILQNLAPCSVDLFHPTHSLTRSRDISLSQWQTSTISIFLGLKCSFQIESQLKCWKWMFSMDRCLQSIPVPWNVVKHFIILEYSSRIGTSLSTENPLFLSKTISKKHFLEFVSNHYCFPVGIPHVTL